MCTVGFVFAGRRRLGASGVKLCAPLRRSRFKGPRPQLTAPTHAHLCVCVCVCTYRCDGTTAVVRDHFPKWFTIRTLLTCVCMFWIWKKPHSIPSNSVCARAHISTTTSRQRLCVGVCLWLRRMEVKNKCEQMNEQTIIIITKKHFLFCINKKM